MLSQSKIVMHRKNFIFSSAFENLRFSMHRKHPQITYKLCGCFRVPYEACKNIVLHASLRGSESTLEKNAKHFSTHKKSKIFLMIRMLLKNIIDFFRSLQYVYTHAGQFINVFYVFFSYDQLKITPIGELCYCNSFFYV